MQFIDLATQLSQVREEVLTAVSSVLDHGQYIMGPDVRKMEAELAEYIGVKHCIAMASGTVALQVALMALNVGPGDEVITSAFSFFATVEVIKLLGATPVFVDIDKKTYNINPALLEEAITSKTKAIMPVSLYGQCADVDAINEVASRHGIAVIEDGAQSFGSEYKGQRSLGLSEIGCTSFFPSKPLGCYGDGGACFTNDDNLASLMRSIINHGQAKRYQHVRVGINGRMDSMQAAIVSVKFQKLFQKEVVARQQVAKMYQKHLSEVVQTPYVESHNLSMYAQYTIEVEDRAYVQEQLKQQGIPTAVHYPKALHQQPALAESFQQQNFPVSERAAQRVMSLPFHPYLQEADVVKVVQGVKESLSVDTLV